MAPATRHRTQAKSETSKRLLAQMINEALVHIHQVACSNSTAKSLLHITNESDSSRWIQVNVMHGMKPTACTHWRPNDFGIPVVLQTDASAIEEDDPGSIWEFIAPWLPCDDGTVEDIARELRNSAAMLEKWMDIGAVHPALDLGSSFLDWERSVITGHPTHPFHRTCYATDLLEPVGPGHLPTMLNPGLSFLKLTRSSVSVSGAFEHLTKPLLEQFEIDACHSETSIVVPCLSQQLPALQHFFPDAELIKSIPNCAEAQAAIRTVSVPGYQFDIKFSLACLITSAIRALPFWAAAAAPDITRIVKDVFPAELWAIGEVAAVTGSQKNLTEARHLTCILRENLESKARENDETLIIASALMEKPVGSQQTHAEILFNLETREDKIKWFTNYLECLLPLALDPLRRYGIGCEFHAQNTIARVCRKTKTIKGFAVRDLAGIKVHRPTLEREGFDLSNITSLCTDDVYQVWDRVHHALLQNNIGYMLYALGLERADNGWAIVRPKLSDVLELDSDPTGQEIYRYFTQETMPFKCFMRMRMGVSFGNSIPLMEKRVPNVLLEKSRWLRQISLAATKDADRLISPEHVNPETRVLETDALSGRLLESVRPYGQMSPQNLNTYPAVLPRQFLEDLESFNEALMIALDNIIQRWWKDHEADLPNRMPLEPRIETLLRWVDQASDEGIMRPFNGSQGNMRPDILVPMDAGHGFPQFRLCEINGRFPINYLSYTAFTYQGIAGSTWHTPLLKPASEYKKFLDSLLKLFNPGYPIHFVRETAGVPEQDPMFGFLEERTGIRPRLVRPSDLRLVPDSTRKTGFILCCVCSSDAGSITGSGRALDTINWEGELLEEVHQIALQLFNHELFGLPTEMVHHIALCCRNDIRTVFIAHDKRILGIIHQELDSLVHKQRVLTSTQAQLLRERIIPTYLPGSSELKDLVRQGHNDPQMKDKFILKPIREARGTGILLGKDISVDQWESILKSMQSPGFDSAETTYMLQPFIKLQTLDWFWDEKTQIRKSRMVGTYYSVNGRFVGLGIWRTGGVLENVISASTKDVTLLLSTVHLGS